MGEFKSFSTINPSMANIYGSVTGSVIQFYKRLFPKNAFKHVNINTEIPLRKFKVQEIIELMKKSKPILSIMPRVDFQYESEYFQNLPLFGGFKLSHESNFFHDPDKEIYLNFDCKEIKIDFEFNVIVETAMQQINFANHLNSKIYHNNLPYYLDVITEIPLARELMYQIAKDAGYLNLDDTITDINQFISYVNSHSKLPVFFKMKTSSGKNEFFTAYKQTLLYNFEGLPELNDGEKKGMVKNNFTIRDRMIVKAIIPSLFYYVSDTRHDLINNFTGAEGLMETNIIPIYTIDYSLIKGSLENGYNLSFSSAYSFDNDVVEEIIDLNEILDTRIKKVLEYHSLNNININFFKIIIIKNDEYLDEVANNFKLDLTDPIQPKLIIYNGEVNSRYHILIYQDDSYINSIIEKIWEIG